MSNYEKYKKIFEKLFNVSGENLSNLKYQDVPEWDSVGHMELITELEDAFDIEMETDDIIDFNSFEVGLTLLKNKYNVEF